MGPPAGNFETRSYWNPGIIWNGQNRQTLCCLQSVSVCGSAHSSSQYSYCTEIDKAATSPGNGVQPNFIHLVTWNKIEGAAVAIRLDLDLSAHLRRNSVFPNPGFLAIVDVWMLNIVKPFLSSCTFNQKHACQVNGWR